MKEKAENQTETEAFKRWFGDSKVVDEDGKPLIMYHGTPYGGFSVFKDWQYFTSDKAYADKYHNPSASSVRGRYDPATDPMTYATYLRVEKPFDTRDPKIRKIWQTEFYDHYSRTPLSEKGLPDWTSGIDLAEFIEDNDYDFDAIILDEGGVGGYTDDVKSRGISVVVRNSAQIKSATDNVGTFDANDPDIRYSLKDDADETTEDSYVRYAMKDGDGRSEEDIRQEYREDISPLVEADEEEDAVKREKEQKSADLIREEYEGTLAPMLQGEKDATGKWTKAMQQAENERRRDNALTMAAIQDLEEAQERSVKQAVATIGTAAMLSEVNWLAVGSASLLAGVLSVLTSIATGLPETGEAVEKPPEE